MPNKAEVPVLNCRITLVVITKLRSTDSYVRVTGQLKSFHNKRHIGAHHIRPVTDHNEVLFHLLEATSVHLLNLRGPPGHAKPAGMHTNGSHMHDAMDGIIAGGQIGGQQNNAKFDYLPPLQRQIMIFVHNAPPTNEGVHVQTIAQAIQTHSATVMHAVEQLTTDGQLYTTIDDDHVCLYPLFTDHFR
jgi:replication factor A2